MIVWQWPSRSRPGTGSGHEEHNCLIESCFRDFLILGETFNQGEFSIPLPEAAQVSRLHLYSTASPDEEKKTGALAPRASAVNSLPSSGIRSEIIYYYFLESYLKPDL